MHKTIFRNFFYFSDISYDTFEEVNPEITVTLDEGIISRYAGLWDSSLEPAYPCSVGDA